MAGKKKSDKFKINPYFILPIHDGAYAEGGNIDAMKMAIPFDAIGTVAGNLLGDFTGGEDNRSNVVANSAAEGALKGAGQLASMGSMFGPIGTLAGAGVGAIGGGLVAGINAQNTLEENFNNATTGLRANGGRIHDYNLGGDISMVNGPRHEQGGVSINPNVEVEGGEAMIGNEVLSDRLLHPETGRTFAQEAERVKAKYKERANDGPSMKAQAAEIAKLVAMNDAARAAQEQTDKELSVDAMAYGGCIKRGNGGKLEVDPNMVPSLKLAAKLRNMDMNSYTEKLFALGGNIDFANGGNIGDPPPPTPEELKYQQQLEDYNFWNENKSTRLLGEEIPLNDPRAKEFLTSPTGLPLTKLYQGSGANLYHREYAAPTKPAVVVPKGITPPNIDSDNKLVDVKPEKFVFDAVTELWPSDTNRADYKTFTPDEVAKRFGAGETHPALGPRWSSDVDPTGKQIPGNSGTSYERPSVIRNTEPRIKALGGPFNESILDNSGVSTLPLKPLSPFEIERPGITSNNPNEIGMLPTRAASPLENAFNLEPTSQSNYSSLDFNPLGEDPMIQDPTKTREFGAEEMGLLASSLPALDNFTRGLKPENTIYNKIEPEYIDLSAARDAISREATQASNIQRANIRGNAKSSGEAISALATGEAGIVGAEMNALLQSHLGEAEMNTNLKNAANQTNTQTKNLEIDVNAQNKAMAQSLQNLSLSDMSANIQGYVKDKKLTAENIKKNDQIMSIVNAISPNYKWENDNGKWALEFVKVMNQLPQETK